MRPLLLLPALAVTLVAQAPTEALFLGDPAAVARTCADRALALKAGKEEFHVLRGQALAAEGRRAEAEAAFTQALRLAPRDMDTHAGIARGYLRLGDRRAAQAALDAVVATRPKSPVPCRLAAQIWREVGDLGPVRPLAEKALQLAPQAPAAAAEFAVDLLDMGFAKEAFALMEVVQPLAPKNWEVRASFGAACLRAHRPKDAETWFQRAILAYPREVDSRKAMVHAYVEFGTREDCLAARPALQEALDIAYPPKDRDPEALALMARLHLLLGEREEAEARFREIVMHKEAGAEAFRLIGNAWMKAGFEAEALRAYDVVISGKGVGAYLGFGIGGGGTPTPGIPGAPPAPVGGGGPMFGIDLAQINRKRALFDAAVDLATLGFKARALPLADEAYLMDPEDFDNMATFGKLCFQKGWRVEGARYLALGGKKGYKDREYWFAVGQALLETLPLPAPASPHP
ncbi:MAG TPA: tetratricopeptide repeat protein [Holophagaceae bacterium]|nr:tetratricopeptide repeat protein [Holophagaceae bacterium]